MRKKIITLIIWILIIVPFTTIAIGESIEDKPDYVDVSVNNAPYAPVILKEKTGWKEDTFKMVFSSEDPDGNDVYYQVDWGKKESGENLLSKPDDPQKAWYGPFKSGEEVALNHKWCEKGTYTVVIKAKDTYDLESPETTLTVTHPKVKILHDSIVYQLFERLANVFPLLREIIKLL